MFSESCLEIPFSASTVISGVVNAICSPCTAGGTVLNRYQWPSSLLMELCWQDFALQIQRHGVRGAGRDWPAEGVTVQGGLLWRTCPITAGARICCWCWMPKVLLISSTWLLIYAWQNVPVPPQHAAKHSSVQLLGRKITLSQLKPGHLPYYAHLVYRQRGNSPCV